MVAVLHNSRANLTTLVRAHLPFHACMHCRADGWVDEWKDRQAKRTERKAKAGPVSQACTRVCAYGV